MADDLITRIGRTLRAVSGEKTSQSPIVSLHQYLAMFAAETTWRMVTVSTPATAVRVLPGNMRRTAIIFSAHGGPLWISPSPLVTTEDGIELASASNPLIITLLTNGSMVQSEWWGQSNIAPSTLTIVELTRT